MQTVVPGDQRAAPETTGMGTRPRSVVRSRLAPLVALAAIILPINFLHVAKIATISPLDELMHIDYLIRASHPGFLRMSDTFTQEAMNEIACRGHPTQKLPPCGKRPYDPQEFSWKGRNLASSHSPYYYLVTGVLARPLRALLPGDSLVTWARVLGSAWLLLGLGLTLAVGRRLGLSEWSLVPFLGLIALSPSTQHAATTVNPDATGILAGAAVLWATVRVAERTAPVWWVFAASIGAVLLDPGNVLAVLAMCGFGLFVTWPQVRRPVAIVGCLCLGFVAAQVVDRLLLHFLGTVDYTGNPQDLLFTVASLHGPMVWSDSALLALVPPTKGYVFPALATPAHLTAAAVATLIATIGIVIPAVRPDGEPRLRLLAQVGLATLVLGGPFLVLTRFVLGSEYFVIPARYGLSLLPIVGLAGGYALSRSWYGKTMVALALAALACTAVYALV